jgi:glycerol-3-phosphate O-acyltransferase
VPGCLNYDRVLEDRALTAEARGKKPERSLLRMFKRTMKILFRGSLKLALRRTRKHGYAALRLGAPVPLEGWLARGGREALELPREARAPHVKRLADELMAEVARLMPVPCVPLLSLALLELEGEEGARREAAVDRDALVERVARLRRAIEAAGGRLVRADKMDAELVDYACLLLETRGTLVRLRDGRLRMNEADREIFRYYASSIAHFVGAQADSAPAAAASRAL